MASEYHRRARRKMLERLLWCKTRATRLAPPLLSVNTSCWCPALSAQSGRESSGNWERQRRQSLEKCSLIMKSRSLFCNSRRWPQKITTPLQIFICQATTPQKWALMAALTAHAPLLLTSWPPSAGKWTDFSPTTGQWRTNSTSPATPWTLSLMCRPLRTTFWRTWCACRPGLALLRTLLPRALARAPPPKASWEDTRWWAAVTGSSVWSRWRRSLTGASAAAPSSTATVSSGSTCRHFLKSFWWVLSMCCHGNSAVNVLSWQQCCQCAVMATVLSMCCHGNSAVNVLSWQQWYIYTSASPDDGVL